MSRGTYLVRNDNDIGKGPILGIRHLQVLLLFLMLLIMQLGSNISVVILAMTDSTTSSNPDIPTYDWDNKNVILSSSLWGMASIEVFTGQIARIVGPKWIIFGSMALGGSSTLLTPLVVQYCGSTGLIVLRVAHGVFTAFLISAMMSTISLWIPKTERSSLAACAILGTNIGGVLSGVLTGLIASSWLGWPMVFYINGSLTLLWALLWFFFGSNSPEVDPRISEEEKEYIMNSLEQVQHAEKIKTPWKAILTSIPFWALAITGIGNTWLTITFQMETASFMKNALNIDLKTTSLLTTFHSIIAPIAAIVSAVAADILISKNILSITAVRKTIHMIGTVISGILCFWLAFITEEHKTTAVVVISLAYSLQSLCVNSYGVNFLDLSPNFSGVMYGIVDGLAQGISILSPLLVQVIVKDETDIYQWRTIFIVIGVIVSVTGLVFIVFGSGNKQWWDNGADGRNKIEEDEEEINQSDEISKI